PDPGPARRQVPLNSAAWPAEPLPVHSCAGGPPGLSEVVDGSRCRLRPTDAASAGCAAGEGHRPRPWRAVPAGPGLPSGAGRGAGGGGGGGRGRPPRGGGGRGPPAATARPSPPSPPPPPPPESKGRHAPPAVLLRLGGAAGDANRPAAAAGPAADPGARPPL